MANILLEIGKGVEVGAEDLLAWATKAQKAGPAVVAALGVLLAGTEKALSDVQSDATNPLAILLGGATQLTDFTAAWSDLKAFAQSLGVKL